MENKTFNELSFKEKWRLQEIVKRRRKAEKISEEEERIYMKFIKEYEAVEGNSKSKWPIIILLIITSLIAILVRCNS